MTERFQGIRRVFRLGAWRRELEDELAFHHESTVAELIRSGLSPAEAEAEARRRFGNPARYRRELENIDQRGATFDLWGQRLDVLVTSVKYAFRRLGRAPLFSVGIIVTFALGIGANATMFSILDRILLSPPPHVAEPETLRRVNASTYPTFVDVARTSAFSSVAATARYDVTLGSGEDAGPAPTNLVTGNFFTLLGVQPALGRFFGPEDDVVGGAGLAVISHRVWQSRYGSDPGVIGRTLNFGDGPFTIVAVAPKGFTGVDLAPVDVWLPLHSAERIVCDARVRCFDNRGWRWIHTTIARIRPGVTDEQAEEQATASLRAGLVDNPPRGGGTDPAGVRAELTPLMVARGPYATQEARVAFWVAGISLFVLLIACANIANLLIAQLSRERREAALRLAVGCSRARLVGQVVVQSLILATLGGVAAILVALWGGAAVRAFFLPDLAWDAPGLGTRTALFTLGLATIAGLIAAVFPAVQFGRSSVGELLKSEGSSTLAWSTRTRGLLTAAQAAFSVVLLVGAGLFVRSLENIDRLGFGIDPEGILLVRPTFDGATPVEEQRRLFGEATERLSHIPGVQATSRDVSIPFLTRVTTHPHTAAGDSLPQDSLPTGHTVDPAYFGMMGLQIRRGRGFGPEDSATSPPVAVVDETLARRLWPDTDPLGTCVTLYTRPECIVIVGVVDSQRDQLGYFLSGSAPPHIYFPAEQQDLWLIDNGILLKVSGDTKSVLPGIRRELLALDPQLRFVDVTPLWEMLDRGTRSWRLGATLFSIFGLLALLVAGVGLYSICAYAVAQRRFEMGIRSALGARPGQLIALVFQSGMSLAGIGVVAGIATCYLLAPLIEDLLFEVSPRDPITLFAVAVTLLAVAALASVVPAKRAIGVDPAVVLRAE